ncbi:MAG: hypothetical protein ACAF41_09700 [Leptolyngbya sp. BL-A-14]
MRLYLHAVIELLIIRHQRCHKDSREGSLERHTGAIRRFDRVVLLDAEGANASDRRWVARQYMGKQEGTIVDCPPAVALCLT